MSCHASHKVSSCVALVPCCVHFRLGYCAWSAHRPRFFPLLPRPAAPKVFMSDEDNDSDSDSSKVDEATRNSEEYKVRDQYEVGGWLNTLSTIWCARFRSELPAFEQRLLMPLGRDISCPDWERGLRPILSFVQRAGVAAAAEASQEEGTGAGCADFAAPWLPGMYCRETFRPTDFPPLNCAPSLAYPFLLPVPPEIALLLSIPVPFVGTQCALRDGRQYFSIWSVCAVARCTASLWT